MKTTDIKESGFYWYSDDTRKETSIISVDEECGKLVIYVFGIEVSMDLDELAGDAIGPIIPPNFKD